MAGGVAVLFSPLFSHFSLPPEEFSLLAHFARRIREAREYMRHRVTSMDSIGYPSVFSISIYATLTVPTYACMHVALLDFYSRYSHFYLPLLFSLPWFPLFSSHFLPFSGLIGNCRVGRVFIRGNYGIGWTRRVLFSISWQFRVISFRTARHALLGLRIAGFFLFFLSLSLVIPP